MAKLGLWKRSQSGNGQKLIGGGPEVAVAAAAWFGAHADLHSLRKVQTMSSLTGMPRCIKKTARRTED